MVMDKYLIHADNCPYVNPKSGEEEAWLSSHVQTMALCPSSSLLGSRYADNFSIS